MRNTKNKKNWLFLNICSMHIGPNKFTRWFFGHFWPYLTKSKMAAKIVCHSLELKLLHGCIMPGSWKNPTLVVCWLVFGVIMMIKTYIFLRFGILADISVFLIHLINATMKWTLVQFLPNSVKLNSLDLQCFHCPSWYNEVWRRGPNITFFSRSSHSKTFPVTSLRFTELEKCQTHVRSVKARLETGLPSSPTSLHHE